MNRKKKYLVVDVETANSVNCPLVYDIGFAVVDKYGEIYEQKSVIVRDVFFLEAKLMQTAYYTNKISNYLINIGTGQSLVMDLQQIKREIRYTMEKYNISTVVAYNAYFDVTALNNTLRYVTKSKQRWFFPYAVNGSRVEINCIWNMACQTIYKQRKFADFCLENGLRSNFGNLSTSAETGYKFLTKDEQFAEKHMGLDDVLIEAQIMTKCFAAHKSMDRGINRNCWQIPTKYHKEYINKKKAVVI